MTDYCTHTHTFLRGVYKTYINCHRLESFIGLVKAPDRVLSLHLLMWTHVEQVQSVSRRDCQDSKGQTVLIADLESSPVYTIDVNDRNHFREADNQKRNRTSKVVKKGQPVVSGAHGKYEPQEERHQTGETWGESTYVYFCPPRIKVSE